MHNSRLTDLCVCVCVCVCACVCVCVCKKGYSLLWMKGWILWKFEMQDLLAVMNISMKVWVPMVLQLFNQNSLEESGGVTCMEGNKG